MPFPLPPDKRSPRGSGPQQPVPLRRGVERAAGDINPILAIFAVGLAILVFTCYVGLAVTRHPLAQAVAGSAAAVPALAGSGGATTAAR
jgi:hypothetical protein